MTVKLQLNPVIDVYNRYGHGYTLFIQSGISVTIKTFRSISSEVHLGPRKTLSIASALAALRSLRSSTGIAWKFGRLQPIKVVQL